MYPKYYAYLCAMKKKAIIICAIVMSLALSIAAVVSRPETMIRSALQGGRWVNKEGVAFTFANDTLLYIDDIHSDGLNTSIG